MYCKFCHRPIADDSLVCPHCGKPNTPSPKKKLSAVQVFIFTFVFLLAVGLAASAFPHIQKLFSDKKVETPITDEGETLPTFTKESTESIHGSLGNSIANYSSDFVLLAECKDYIFHSYNKDFQITMVEKSTDNSTPLPIYGINLSIYNNKLYYTLGGYYYSYDLLTGMITEHWIHDYKVPSTLLDRFFVTDSGFVAISSVPSVIYTIDFSGNLLSKKTISGSDITLVTPNSVAICDSLHCFLANTTDLMQISMPIPSSRDAVSFGDGNIYRVSSDNLSIIQISPESKTFKIAPISFASHIYGATNNVIYYQSKEGTEMLSIENGKTRCYSNDYFFAEMSFTTNGFIYGMAIPSDTDYSKGYDYVYVRSKLDGSDMTVLSN